MFQSIQSQFDLIFGKGNPLLAAPSPTLQATYDDDEDELDEDEEGSGYWDDSWDEGDEDDDEDDYEEEEEEDCEGGFAWGVDAFPDDEDDYEEEEDCEGGFAWVVDACPDDEDDYEDDYEEEEDEGTEYRNSSDCLFKAIEKANDSLDD